MKKLTLSFVFLTLFYLTKAQVVSVDVKVFLEGPFNGIDMNTNLNSAGLIPLAQPYNQPPWNYTGIESVPSVPLNVVDWVLVEMRETIGEGNGAGVNTSIARQAGFLRNDGKIVTLDGENQLQFSVTITSNIFIVIWHRNHLNIMSAEAVNLVGGIYAYDFTDNYNKAYGGVQAQKEISTGIWCMIAGNGNGDYIINENDKFSYWNSFAGNTGYMNGDYNMDGQTENTDKDDFWIINNEREAKVPWWETCTGTSQINYGGKVYSLVQIGTQCWFKENLNIGTILPDSNHQTNNGVIEMYCYNDNSNNCNNLGGLYQWHEALQYNMRSGSQGICPEGWHIPDYYDWMALSNYAGGMEVAGGKMKETGLTHWNYPNTGATNETGFTALSGGWNYPFSWSQEMGLKAFFLTSGITPNGWFLHLNHNNANVFGGSTSVDDYAMSVRCIKHFNQEPGVPSFYTPEDGANNISINTNPIVWNCSDPDNDPITYDVYFGTNNPPEKVATNQNSSLYYINGSLNYNTTYYWKIVVFDNHNSFTEGQVWSFTTEQQP